MSINNKTHISFSRAYCLLLVLSLCLVITGCASLGSASGKSAKKKSDREHMLEVSATLREADNLYRVGDLNGAQELYLQVIKQESNNPDALYRLGNLSFKQGAFDEAADYFSAALEARPRNAKAHYNLAVTYLTLAEQNFKFYSATAPENADLTNISAILADIYSFATGNQSTRASSSVYQTPESGQSQSSVGSGAPSTGTGNVIDALESLADEFD